MRRTKLVSIAIDPDLSAYYDFELRAWPEVDSLCSTFAENCNDSGDKCIWIIDFWSALPEGEAQFGMMKKIMGLK